MKLNELSPSEVFSYFEKICSISHGSGNTGMIADYCLEFAKLHGLKARKDTSDNVVIFKAGSSGYEDCEPVILQGHLDMVCEKEPDCDIDMSVQSIKACSDGKMVWADGTTLGADDELLLHLHWQCLLRIRLRILLYRQCLRAMKRLECLAQETSTLLTLQQRGLSILILKMREYCM